MYLVIFQFTLRDRWIVEEEILELVPSNCVSIVFVFHGFKLSFSAISFLYILVLVVYQCFIYVIISFYVDIHAQNTCMTGKTC